MVIGLFTNIFFFLNMILMMMIMMISGLLSVLAVVGKLKY